MNPTKCVSLEEMTGGQDITPDSYGTKFSDEGYGVLCIEISAKVLGDDVKE